MKLASIRPGSGMSALDRPTSGPLDRARVALLVVSIALLSTAGAIGLIEPTETRYAEIAREMRASGDYVIPRLDGIPHFDKPPLAYWAVAAGFAALGENEWGARVPAALAALITLAFAAHLARRRFAALRVAPGLAVWMLGGSLLFMTLGRAVASDCFLAATVAAFWALAPSAWGLAALGLGLLAKGPVVLVPTVLPIVAAAAWGRERGSLRLLGPAWGWALFAAVALPWYVIALARTPGLLHYFLTHELWERYTTQVHQRGGPPWYFVGVLLAGALPWTPAVLAGIGRLWRERARPEARLLLCWLVAPLAFFSFSGSKLPAYLLPCFPAVGLMAALGLGGGGRGPRWATGGALAAMAVAGWIAGPRAFAHLAGLPPPRALPLPMPAHVALACLAYASTWLIRSRPAVGGLLVVLAFTALLVALAPYEGSLGSPRPVARMLAENRAAGEPIVEFARFNAGLPFYLRERVRLLEVPREIVFEGPARHPSLFITRDSLVALAGSRPRVWLLGPRVASGRLAASLGLNYRRVSDWRHEALGFVSR